MRREDWLTALRETVEASTQLPFVWGSHDCCFFGARCLDAIHGTDFVERLRLEYSDQDSALTFIAKHGSLENAISSYLGAPQKMALTQRGQLCMVPTELGPGVGVCLGPQVAVAAESGLQMYPFGLVIKSWPDP